MPKGEHKLSIDFIKSECLKRDIQFIDSEYVNNSFKHKFRCLIHNRIHKSMVRSVINGNNKLICCGSGAKRHSIEYVKEKCLAKGFELISKEYSGINVKHYIKCLKHNKTQLVQPRQIFNGHGLKCCGHEKLGGKNNYNYNPALTDKERIYRRSGSLNNKWVRLVKIKYNYTCQTCGYVCDKKYSSISHHLESYRANPKIRYEVSNGICLCKKCHDEFHKKYGYGNNNSLQIEEFKMCHRGQHVSTP